MQPCNRCHACSFPDRVTEAKNRLPDAWVAELMEEDAPDHVWLAALNLYDSFVSEDTPIPARFSDMLRGGVLDASDMEWAEEQIADMHLA